MEDALRFADELGPFKIIHVHEPSRGLKGTLVVDNVAIGPSIGGLRMANDVSTAECFRLARAMTFKNAAAGLAHGGGKSVLYGDPRMEAGRKQELIRAMACALGDITEYIFGPDMGTDETCMAWVHDEIARAVGLPRELGGIPLDELGATGWGLRHATQAALAYCDFRMKGARSSFRASARSAMNAARFLVEEGAVLVGVCDSAVGCSRRYGSVVASLSAPSTPSVSDYEGGQKIDRDSVIDIPCEIWIPAARPDVIDRLQRRPFADQPGHSGRQYSDHCRGGEGLHERGVLSVPDFIANAGGVICAAMEYQKAHRGGGDADRRREDCSATPKVSWPRPNAGRVSPRRAALDLAVSRANGQWSFVAGRSSEAASSAIDEHVSDSLPRTRWPGRQDGEPDPRHRALRGGLRSPGRAPLWRRAAWRADLRLRSRLAAADSRARRHPGSGSGRGHRRHPAAHPRGGRTRRPFRSLGAAAL